MANYDQLTLEKGMYAVAGKTFTQVLESLDPSEQYKGTALEHLDAFERQLKRYDIHVNGKHSDPVAKFFATTSSAALFPEYVKRTVQNGMLENDLLSQIIASKTYIDALDYRSITSTPGFASLEPVEEGEALPETTIGVNSNLVKLQKCGSLLVASYEAIRYQRLDLFGVTLKQIGTKIMRQQLQNAIAVLMNGNNDDDAAEQIALLGSAFTYADLVRLWSEFEEFQMNTLLVGTNAMLKLLALEELQNPATGLNFQGTGKLTTPLGANLYRNIAVNTDTMIALDKNCALEMVCAGDTLVEYDKLIDQQLERAAITATCGFTKIFPDACKTMKVTG